MKPTGYPTIDYWADVYERLMEYRRTCEANEANAAGCWCHDLPAESGLCDDGGDGTGSTG